MHAGLILRQEPDIGRINYYIPNKDIYGPHL